MHCSCFFRAAAKALVFVALVMTHTRAARANEPGTEPLPAAYIPAGSELSYVAVRAPLPARQLGVIALAGLEKLGRPAVEVPSVLGAAPEDTPPRGWPGAPIAGGRRGRMPLAAARDDGSCNCATSLGPVRDERVAVLFAARAFHVGEELERVRLLRLRARYEDGLVVHINGREVARRNLSADAAPMAVAERPHGPEWETFYIPVVPGLLRPGANLLSVEVRPSGRRAGPYLDLALEPAEGARIVRGPMLQRVGPDFATLVFETDQPVTGRVEYGATPALGQVARSAGGGLALRHVIDLRDLPTSTAVHYRIVAGDNVATPAAVFHTAPASGDVVRIAVYGDVRGGHDVHGQLVQAMLDEAPDFVLVTGDLVMRGSDEGDWQRFFEVTEPLIARVPFYPAAGNHDTGRSGDQALRMNEIFELWPGPEDRPEWGHWYSFDVSDIHMVMLDSNAYDSRAQLEWLERDLQAARARGTRAIFAVAHDGPYSRGIHQGNPTALEHYVPVMRRHDVTMMFTGHDHLYQRGDIDGFRYIVSGGGGAPLYSVRCGGKGQPRCRSRDGMRHVTSEHHYIMVTVYRTHIEICPKRADGSHLEPCLSLRARK